MSVVGRDGRLYAHDDSVPLITDDDGALHQAQNNEQSTEQTTSEETTDLPPPYTP